MSLLLRPITCNKNSSQNELNFNLFIFFCWNNEKAFLYSKLRCTKKVFNISKGNCILTN